MKQPRIKSACLKAIINGEAIPCGSGCYQTSDGSGFLGKLPLSARKEINRLTTLPLSKTIPTTLLFNLKKIAAYSGGAL